MAETGFNAVQLGDTIPGTDSSGGLVNASLLGTIKRFDNLALTAGDSVKALRSHGPVWGVLLRNLSGGALLGKRLALCKQTAGYSIIEAASGYGAALYDAPVVAIDPWLPTAGVANNDIFIGVFYGPTILMAPSSGSDILATAAVGTPLVCSDDNNGRITPAAPASDSAVYNAANAVFGRSLYAFSSAATDQEIAVYMHCPWFPTG